MFQNIPVHIFRDINPRILHEYNGETCYKPKRYVDVKMKSIVATYLSVFEEHTHTQEPNLLCYAQYLTKGVMVCAPVLQ